MTAPVQIPEQLSENFRLAKSCSLLMVVIGHFYQGSFLWIPVSIALFIFGFSSGLFTASKYQPGTYDIKLYWKNKLIRLGVRVLLANSFLILLLLTQGHRQEILTWHTFVHVIGATGMLNWFFLQDQSILGNGLWFFTLLLLFYIFYPIINYAFDKHSICKIVASAIVVHLCQYYLPMGHQLWLTSFSFLAGVGITKTKFDKNIKKYSAWSTPLIAVTLGILYILSIHTFNFSLLLLFSLSLSLWLTTHSLPCIFPAAVSFLNKNMLEIYFIHSYLFISPTTHNTINLIMSLLLVLGTSRCLSYASRRIQYLISDDLISRVLPFLHGDT